MGPCTTLLLVTGLFVVGWTSYVNSASIQGHCPPGHFPCHRDCCIEEVHFCSDTQQRCRKCEIFQEECEKQKPQAKVHPHCFLFCHQYRLASNTTPVPSSSTAAYSPEDDNQDSFVPVLTPEILTAIVVPCVLLFSCVVMVCFCRNRRQDGLTESSPRWLRAVFGLFNKKCCRPEVLSREGVAVVYHNGPKSTEESHKDETGVTSPLMPKGHNDTDGQTAEDFVEDKTLHSYLQKRSSNGTLDSNEGHLPSEAKEISDAVIQQSAVEKDASQQREVSLDNTPTSSRGTHGQGDITSLSSPSSFSGGEGAGHSSESSPSPAASGDSARRSNDRNNDSRRANAGDPTYSNGGLCCQSDGNMTQSNQTHINIYTQGGGQPPPVDFNVSTPPNSAYPGRSDASTGSPSSAQAPYNPSPQCNDQRLNSKPADLTRSDAPIASSSGAQVSYSPSPRCNDQRLYTNPSKPPDHEQETVELATGVGNPTWQYRHLQNPIT